MVFDRYESYIEDTSRREKIMLEPKGGLYMLKMWVPREQPFPRRGQSLQDPSRCPQVPTTVASPRLPRARVPVMDLSPRESGGAA